MNITVYLSSSTGNNSNKKSLALPYVKSGIYIICSQICFYIKKIEPTGPSDATYNAALMPKGSNPVYYI